MGGFQPAWLQKFSNKRVIGPTRDHGLIAKLFCDFSKAAGHNSPIMADFLDTVPESSLRKSDFPQQEYTDTGVGSFHTMSHKIPESLLHSKHSTDASAVDRAMPLYGNQ